MQRSPSDTQGAGRGRPYLTSTITQGCTWLPASGGMIVPMFGPLKKSLRRASFKAKQMTRLGYLPRVSCDIAPLRTMHPCCLRGVRGHTCAKGFATICQHAESHSNSAPHKNTRNTSHNKMRRLMEGPIPSTPLPMLSVRVPETCSVVVEIIAGPIWKIMRTTKIGRQLAPEFPTA